MDDSIPGLQKAASREPATGSPISRRRVLELAAGSLAVLSGADLVLHPTTAYAAKKLPTTRSAKSSVQDQITALADEAMKRTGTPGIAVGVVLNGMSAWYFFGEARTDTHARITPGTVFGLGSVTKTVTSTMLAYQTITNPTKYHLSDPVSQHLPAVVAQKGSDIKKVTLQELASHTASFPHSSGINGEELFMDKPPSAALINFWETFKAPKNDPIGSQYIYADIGFVTLGYAIAGNAYNTLIQSSINKPLGLTQFGSAMMMPKQAAYAQGHLDKKGKTTAIDTFNTDLMASPTDYMTYLKAHMGLLKLPSTLDKAMKLTHKKVFSTPASTGIDLGLSWQLMKAAPYIIDKDGASGRGGCQSYIGFIPGTQNGALVLMNKFFISEYPGYGATGLGRKILGIVASA